MAAIREMFADDLTWHEFGRGPLAGTYTGHRGHEARPACAVPGEVPGQFLAGRAGAKKSVSSWVTRSASS
jgi:hypothetical protein